uniref:EGF domain-specific O-linked N-acetylglucosamine transferase n=1 Tax=Lynceus sp. MCZ IZ 141354 TaxID=1930659 RepID=A0A9N6ZH14_9CRUS|nr:EOG090X02IK [Lynceus sp. MCZ IZ 141354]
MDLTLLLVCFLHVVLAIDDELFSGPSDEEWNPNKINLPDSHMTRYLNAFPEEAKKCQNSSHCISKNIIGTGLCWGYEQNCPSHLSYSQPVCNGDHRGWVQTKEAQVESFYKQADFGYVKDHINGMKVICQPETTNDTLLECSPKLQFCRASNLFIDFSDLAKRKEPFRYKMDVLKHGQIGGRCKLNVKQLNDEATHMSPLQSWAPEMQNLIELQDYPCDITFTRPTFIMKIDASVNMYHHFCDFFNLYASLHVNGTHENMFSKDIQIIIWETFSYYSNFKATFDAFTSHPILDLKHLSGKRVCFKNVVFPLLPRMVFGLYYNTPIVWGCENSGLFHAFSKFILHRLDIPRRVFQETPAIKITFLARQTQYRRVLNEEQLLDALRSNKHYIVQRVEFTHSTDFVEQLKIIHDSDILIGMHGAGLTHSLFLPDWAAVFELYNCEDVHCYSDLARLRGVQYFTWVDRSKLQQENEGHHPSGGPHAKFTNYAFDVDEFVRIVDAAADHVRRHEQYQRLHPKDEL